jgi:N-methylhydantoinase A
MVEADARQPVRIAVDIGGTFTDLALLQDGRIGEVVKTPTTPGDPSEGVEVGLARLLRDRPAEQVSEVIHGTTLVANALIERTGAETALLTTRGFRDVLEIGEERRYDMYDLSLEMPRPLVPRRRRWEASERVLANGRVDVPLDHQQARRLARRARREGVEAIAICLLHAYRHPEHERALAEAIAEEAPAISVSLSSEVAPEIGEYVRTSTVVANAYTLPLVSRYLETLARRLRDLGVRAPLHIMLSTGGLATVDVARRFPVRLCESGPAAGALAAAFWAARDQTAGDILAFDMGGTTAKSCLVEAGAPLLARQFEVARVHRFAKGSGLPIRQPVIDLIEIGAGGGSIARIDSFGLLKVGPQSTAGDPGPACYGRGGAMPTVTDADLVLGYLNPQYFLGGEMPLDAEAAGAAIAGLAGQLGMGRQRTAAGIHRVVNENMASAARMHAIERGRDLRNCALVATGGAGPVHAWGLARALRMRSIIYPPIAGVGSAIGMLAAEHAFDFVRSAPSPLGSIQWAEVRALVARLADEGRGLLMDARVPRGEITVSIAADMRYRGQGDSLRLELGRSLGRSPARRLEREFAAAYSNVYGSLPPAVEPEVISWAVRVAGARPGISTTGQAPPPARRPERRPIWSFERDAMIDAEVIDRATLRPGVAIRGPAVLEEPESTVVIGEGGVGRVLASGCIRVELDA